MKRFTSLLLALLMLLAVLVPAYADDGVEHEVTWVNPLYASFISEDDLPAAVPADSPAVASTVSASTKSAAITKLRAEMKKRTSTVTINTGFYMDTSALQDVFWGALEHTGVSTEGDYLHWQVAGYRARYGSRQVTFTFEWYTTAAQERTMDTRVASVLNSLDLKNLTDYGKVRAIYNWITANVRYDHAHLWDPYYYLQYTAYAALVNGTAVCQGYAVLFYRMALEAGVSARVITGVGVQGYSSESHAWNIAKVGSKYYYLDSTWDEGVSASSWRFFLKGANTFEDQHVPSSDPHDGYRTTAFRNKFPISATDYNGSTGLIANGWSTENGNRYYYKNGNRAVGFWLIGGQYYYFSKSTGAMMTGLVNTGSGIRLFADDGHMLTGVQRYNGKTYYFSAKQKGIRLSGLISTDAAGTLRYFSAKTGEMLTGLVNTGNGKLRYFDLYDGHMLTGIVTTAGGSRYFSVNDGHMLKNGWVTGPGGAQYLLDADGWVIGIR